MKIRHINNIVIELEEWESRELLDFIANNINGNRRPLSQDGITTIKTLHEKLDKLTQREA